MGFVRALIILYDGLNPVPCNKGTGCPILLDGFEGYHVLCISNCKWLYA